MCIVSADKFWALKIVSGDASIFIVQRLRDITASRIRGILTASKLGTPLEPLPHNDCYEGVRARTSFAMHRSSLSRRFRSYLLLC
jgi:hypothetical protein